MLRTLEAFNQAMRDIPNVLECHMLGALETVETTHTYFVMEEVKESAFLPVA